MKKPSHGKSVLVRGTNLCKDIPVSEGEYGRPKQLRGGQPGCNTQNVHRSHVELVLEMSARDTVCVFAKYFELFHETRSANEFFFLTEERTKGSFQ